MRTPKLIGLSLIAVALLQSAALGKMVFDRVQLLRTGKEVMLEIVPRDPRDFFRGYYSRLDYRIATVPSARLSREDLNTVSADRGRHTRTVYVVLKLDGSGVYRPVSISLSPSQPAQDEVMVRGTVDYFGSDELRVEYGIESFYLPKDEAAALDLKERDTLRVVAAVGPDGEMAIKRLLVNGNVAYEEAPF